MYSGVDSYTATRRVQSGKSYKMLLSDEVESLERFKVEAVEVINRSAENIASHVNSLVLQRQESLARQAM
jgi:hypothetical protein